MSSVVIAVGQGFSAYAAPVFERCVRIVHTTLIHYNTHQANPTAYDVPDKTFLVVALDLLSGLTQGLNSAIAPLYEASNGQVFSLLLFCIQVSAMLLPRLLSLITALVSGACCQTISLCASR